MLLQLTIAFFLNIQFSSSILSPSWRQTFALSSLASEGLQFEEEPEIDSSLSGDITDSITSNGQNFKRKDLRDPSANDWSKLMNGFGSYECHKIPSNMSLCQEIGYEKMILPNYLQHEDVDEVIQQSDVWLNLVKTECNLDLKKFLCSLYAPVCIEGHEDDLILPCKSLCESVKADCLPKMLKFGFSWPDIVNCSRFPELSNGMCIPKSKKKEMEQLKCVGCQENEDIVKEYCKADFAIRARIGNLHKQVNSSSPGDSKISFWALIGGRPLKRDISERFIPIQVDCFCDSIDKFLFDNGSQSANLGRWLIMGKVIQGPNNSLIYKATYMNSLAYNSFNVRSTIRKIHNYREGICTNSHLLDAPLENQNFRVSRNRRRRNRANRYRRNDYYQQQRYNSAYPKQPSSLHYQTQRNHLNNYLFH